MHTKNCIVISAHISDAGKANTLEHCIKSIRAYAPEYAIILACTGNRKLVRDQIKLVDHYVFTSINSLRLIEEPLTIFYSTLEWTIAYFTPLPRYEYGFAELQKKAIGIQSAMTLGYENFLVMNYDTILFDKGFVEYMFSEPESIFFKYPQYPIKTLCDVYKLNIDGARMLISLASNENLVRELASKYSGVMLEDALGEAIVHYQIKYRKFDIVKSELFQLYPFKVLTNTSHNEGALAAVKDGKLYLLVSNTGHPRHTLDGKLSITYEGKTVQYDVSDTISVLHPICEYENKDVDIIVGTSFGDFHITLKKEVVENTKILSSENLVLI